MIALQTSFEPLSLKGVGGAKSLVEVTVNSKKEDFCPQTRPRIWPQDCVYVVSQLRPLVWTLLVSYSMPKNRLQLVLIDNFHNLPDGKQTVRCKVRPTEAEGCRELTQQGVLRCLAGGEERGGSTDLYCDGRAVLHAVKDILYRLP
jgi:hypothetical protein